MRVDDRHAHGRGAARARARLPPIKGGANASNACRVCDTCRVYAAGAGVCPRAVCSGAARTLPAGHVGRKRGRAAVRGETGHALFGQVKVRQRRWVAAHNAIKRGSSTRVSAGARGGLVHREAACVVHSDGAQHSKEHAPGRRAAVHHTHREHGPPASEHSRRRSPFTGKASVCERVAEPAWGISARHSPAGSRQRRPQRRPGGCLQQAQSPLSCRGASWGRQLRPAGSPRQNRRPPGGCSQAGGAG
jgi:hypothetical protein